MLSHFLWLIWNGWCGMACELCGGPCYVLGVLGNLVHLVCRDCGMACSCAVTDVGIGLEECCDESEG